MPLLIVVILIVLGCVFYQRYQRLGEVVRLHKEISAEAGDISTLPNRPTTDDTTMVQHSIVNFSDKGKIDFNDDKMSQMTSNSNNYPASYSKYPTEAGSKKNSQKDIVAQLETID